MKIVMDVKQEETVILKRVVIFVLYDLVSKTLLKQQIL